MKLFAWDEVRPVHGVSTPLLVAALAERYSFQFKPAPPIPPDTVVKFADGFTVIDKNVVAIQKMDIYSDGFGVDCANTEDAQAVSDEMIKWAQETLGYRDFVRQPQVIFLSQVVVEFDSKIENLFQGWKNIQHLLSGSVQKQYKVDKPVDAYRLQWRGDAHTIVNNILVSDFYIERKITEPYSSNRWHCSGPLPTQEWVNLLEAIEGLAKSNEG